MTDYTLGSNADVATEIESSSTTTASQTLITTRQRRLPTLTRSFQNFILIWLNSNIDESNENYRNSIMQLKRIVNIIYTFDDVDQCADFLTDISDEKIFLITNENLSQQIVPLIHAVSQLDSIYVLCKEKPTDDRWMKEWPKIKCISTEITLLCESLNRSVRQCDQNSISISFISSSDASNPNLNELDQSYMYTQILKEILLEFDYHHEMSIAKHLIAFCRVNADSSNDQTNNFDIFEQEYHLHSPIWWYTSQSFLYSMLNRALRNQEVDIIIRMGFFVHDLHRNIEELYSKQMNDQKIRSLTVYRGQGLSKENFEKMEKSKDGLMSFNNFLSTSTDRDVAYLFADSIQSGTDLIGVIFEMTIDKSISSIPFADLDNAGQFNDEKEILFSMHTIFRIGNIERIDNNDRFWRVELALTSDNDEELNAVTEKIREETQEGSTGPYRLGKFLIKLGEYDKAKQLYELLLDLIPDDISKEHLYHQLGQVKHHEGDYLEAISFYEKSFEIHQRISSSNAFDMATYYNNIGLVYNDMGEYPKALLFYNQALEIEQNVNPVDHLKLAHIYNNIGFVYDGMEDYLKAFEFYEKSLEIKQNILSSNHPSLAISYSNISSVSQKLGEYAKALSFYEKALEMCQKTLPPNHPDLATVYTNIGGVCAQMGEYSKALVYFQKGLEIRQKVYSTYHPALAMSYNNIGLLYISMDEPSKALSCLEKALEIQQKALPVNHPDLSLSHNNIGAAYNLMGDYSKALISHEKALAISQTFIPPNPLSVANMYIGVGNTYNSMGEYSKALSIYKKALDIRQNILPSNHPDLGISYNNIGTVYFMMEDYSNALSSYKQALEIYRASLSLNHPDLALSYSNIAWAYNNIGEYTKAVSYLEKSLEIRERTLSSDHPLLATSYNNIGAMYTNTGDYSKALLYHKKSLVIWQIICPSNHLNLAIAYNNIGLAYESMDEYSMALSCSESAVDIAQQSLSPDHPQLQAYEINLERFQKKCR